MDENGEPGSQGNNEGDGNPVVEPFDEGDIMALRLTDGEVADLEREGLTSAKGIREMKDPGILAGLCGWDKEHAIFVMNRANALRVQQLHTPKHEKK